MIRCRRCRRRPSTTLARGRDGHRRDRRARVHAERPVCARTCAKCATRSGPYATTCRTWASASPALRSVSRPAAGSSRPAPAAARPSARTDLQRGQTMAAGGVPREIRPADPRKRPASPGRLRLRLLLPAQEPAAKHLVYDSPPWRPYWRSGATRSRSSSCRPRYRSDLLFCTTDWGSCGDRNSGSSDGSARRSRACSPHRRGERASTGCARLVKRAGATGRDA